MMFLLGYALGWVASALALGIYYACRYISWDCDHWRERP